MVNQRICRSLYLFGKVNRVLPTLAFELQITFRSFFATSQSSVNCPRRMEFRCFQEGSGLETFTIKEIDRYGEAEERNPRLSLNYLEQLPLALILGEPLQFENVRTLKKKKITFRKRVRPFWIFFDEIVVIFVKILTPTPEKMEICCFYKVRILKAFLS